MHQGPIYCHLAGQPTHKAGDSVDSGGLWSSSSIVLRATAMDASSSSVHVSVAVRMLAGLVQKSL